MPSPSEHARRPDERVLRQLVEAALFEGLIEARVSPSHRAGEYAWTSGRRRYRCRAAAGAFGRNRIEAGSIEADGGDGWRKAELEPLVEDLAGGAALLRELERTIAFSRWNDRNLDRPPRRALPFAQLDAALDEGHPYHPCFKARTGFDEEDHAAFGPEAGRSFRLVWLAIARDRLRQALPCDEDAFWRVELGETGFAALSERRGVLDLDPRAYGLLPVHPWQWTTLKDDGLAPLLAKGSVRLLGEAGDRYFASQSVRTLHNASDPRKGSVKLAMNMANTSSLRTIEPHSVCVAPELSRWIAAILAGDPLFRERYRLTILVEYAGVVADREGPLAGQLAAIWRQSVAQALEPGEEAAPFNALMAVEQDGAPFVDGWVRRFGLAAWLDRLLDVAVAPIWHLLVRHGVAVEAHGQNLILVHRDGWPERLILRDLHDSVEFAADYLDDPAGAPDFAAIDPAYRDPAPDRFHRMETIEELRALTMDSLFVFNLAEIAHLLATFYDLPEADFWARIDLRLRRHAAEHGLQKRLTRLRHDAPSIRVESLLAQKLPGRRRSHLAPNVFASCRCEQARDPHDGVRTRLVSA